ncbi:MAG TPA: phosphatidate cytidylyltransferase [Polyangiaceae bacterium]|nr:phosphatidate cytidylyltransferase [Polyangiaceae bacterium]
MAASNLVQRLLTAAVAVPLLLWLLYGGPAWGFFALVALVSLAGALELFRMTHAGDVFGQGYGMAATFAVLVTLYVFSQRPDLLMGVLLVVPLLGILMPLVRLGDIKTAGLRMMGNVAGPLYLAGPLAALTLLRRDHGTAGPSWVLLALMFAWFADTGGYFFGRFLGKTKLYEAVSPKKTRAGFVGALVGATLGALLAHFWYLPELPLLEGVLLAVLSGAFGQFGDLAESLLKRSIGVKDSGNIVPGHGGILDRIDALLVVAPIVYLYTSMRGL